MTIWKMSAIRWYVSHGTEWDQLGVSYPMFESQGKNRQPLVLHWADHSGGSHHRAWELSRHLHARSRFHLTSQNGSGKRVNTYIQTGKTACLWRETGADFKGRDLAVTGHSLPVTLPPPLCRCQGNSVVGKNSIPVQEAGSTEWTAFEFSPFVSLHFIILNKHLYF